MVKRWFFLIATHCHDHVGNKCLLFFVSNLSDPLPVDAIAHTAHLLTRTKSSCLGVARGNLSKIWECVEAELRWFVPQHCCQRGCSLRLQSFLSNAGGFAWNVVKLQQLACCSGINLWHRQSGWKMNFFASFQDWSKITEGKICSISGRKESKGVFERKSITDTDAPINRKASRGSFDIFVSLPLLSRLSFLSSQYFKCSWFPNGHIWMFDLVFDSIERKWH